MTTTGRLLPEHAVIYLDFGRTFQGTPSEFAEYMCCAEVTRLNVQLVAEDLGVPWSIENDVTYLLQYSIDGPQVEVSKKDWVNTERGAGFRPKGMDIGQPATGGFTSQRYGSMPSYVAGYIHPNHVSEQ